MYLKQNGRCSCGLGSHLVFMPFLRPASESLHTVIGWSWICLLSCSSARENAQPPSNKENELQSMACRSLDHPFIEHETNEVVASINNLFF